MRAASVVVCTRNRSSVLLEACESVISGDHGSLDWELIIVDNGSTDDTPDVARSLVDRHPGLVRVIVEPELGLSAARNAGVRAARGGVIAFLDDDAMASGSWLPELVRPFEGGDVMVAGGPVEPVLLGNRPEWLTDRYLPYLSAWRPGAAAQRLAYDDYPRGANICFRRDVFSMFGPFSPHLGRRGSRLLSCEETEMCLRVERAGGAILYAPEAAVRHLTPVDRLTPAWMIRRFSAQGRSEAVISWRHAGIAGIVRGLWRHLKNAAAAGLGRGAGDLLLGRCQMGALDGYARGTPGAVLRVPRYRGSRSGERPLRWRPPV